MGVTRPSARQLTALAAAVLVAVAVWACQPARTHVASPPPQACIDAERARFTPDERMVVITRQDGLDWWTGLALDAEWEMDHVLPWAWALCHGLRAADAEAFYHDTNNLVATDGTVNRRKSDSMPWEDRWQPDRNRCWWAHSVNSTIDRWQLTPTVDEATALQYLRAACAAGDVT